MGIYGHLNHDPSTPAQRVLGGATEPRSRGEGKLLDGHYIGTAAGKGHKPHSHHHYQHHDCRLNHHQEHMFGSLACHQTGIISCIEWLGSLLVGSIYRGSRGCHYRYDEHNLT